MRLLFKLVASLLFAAAASFEAVLKSNYDGDTLTVNLVNPTGCIPDVFAKDLSIRVMGVDCPELRGECMLEKCLAKKAKTFTQDSLSGAHILFENEARDKYFRVLADVLYQRPGESTYRNLTKEIVHAKLGVPYFGDTKVTDWCDWSSSAFYWSHTKICIKEDPCVKKEAETRTKLTTQECKALLRGL